MVKQTAALRCPCGYGIRCEIWCHGEYLGTVAFFDDDELKRETFGERVEHCPACEQRIVFHRLLSKA
jgi:hypothetical protein